jgi:hypothetical protein
MYWTRLIVAGVMAALRCAAMRRNSHGTLVRLRAQLHEANGSGYHVPVIKVPRRSQRW